MKRHKSGAQKRKEAAAAQESVKKLTKLTQFFSVSRAETETDSATLPAVPISDTLSLVSAAAASTAESENVLCESVELNLPSVPCTSMGAKNAAIDTSSSLPHSSFDPLHRDPAKWPDVISDPQRVDIIRRGPRQVVTNFPYNAARRRFSSIHYKRILSNGEAVPRSWLMYSEDSDKAFCFSCKLFGNLASPFSRGINTWEGFSKKLKDHENGASHKKSFNQWLLLKEGINTQSTVDKQAMKIFLAERTFWRNVLERLIDIVIFLGERNLAFRGSDETLGSSQNGNFLGLFELLAKRDPVLNELQNRIIRHKTNQHYLSKSIQNELINLVAKETENALLTQLKQAKYYSIILDCTPDISHQEQMTVIFRFVQCDDEHGARVKEAFFGYLSVNNSTGEGLLNVFLKRSEELRLDLADCRGQCYDNGANMKGKEAGFQARLLKINPKALYVPCANHSLNLVVVDSVKSSTEALVFFGVLMQLYSLFSSSTQRWTILKKNVPLSLKSQSATRWESRINCISPLRYHLAEVIKALKELENYCFEKKDGQTINDVRSLILRIETWSFILSIVVWHDILFHINKTSKVMQTTGVSMEVVEKEIKATEEVLKKYREDGYSGAVATAREIAEGLQIERSFAESRTRRRRRLFEYEAEDEGSEMSPEEKFKANFFLPLMDHALSSLKERFEQMHTVGAIFNFLYNQESLLQVYGHNRLLNACQKFYETMGDIDPVEMNEELERFVVIVKENKEDLKTANDFLSYIYRKHMLEVYPNLSIALRVLLTCPVSVAGAERSFSKLKLIKTFHRSTMMDERLTSLATISIESSCVRDLDLDRIIDVFAAEKARRKTF